VVVSALAPLACASLAGPADEGATPGDDRSPASAAAAEQEVPTSGLASLLVPGHDTAEAVTEVSATPVLARFEDLELHLLAPSPVVVGYHEAATTAAFGLEPVGALTEDHNTTRTDLPDDVAGGTPYLVLSSRGRAAAPTSALDIVLEPDVPVLAPVSGTVVDVRGFLLYGAHVDLRVEIVPDGRPDLRLVLIHLDEVTVEIGDRVVGGVTPLAGTARTFPFGSHIDRETEPDRFPHVHLELQAVDAPRPGDPRPPTDGPPQVPPRT
jgi:hypothetical protein